MKNLANCNPKEFLSQTNRIRKHAEAWLDLTGILAIRKQAPKLTEDMTMEQKKAAVQGQARENLRAMLDACMDKCPDETAELLGLLCFIEPEDLENHAMSELMGGVSELLGCQEVVDFFTSLVQLGQRAGSGTAQK